jgi:serine/threonine-protein kinase
MATASTNVATPRNLAERISPSYHHLRRALRAAAFAAVFAQVPSGRHTPHARTDASDADERRGSDGPTLACYSGIVSVVSVPTPVGRYVMFDRIAAGGMAAVHLGRLMGEGGFSRTVAIKALHPQFALDPEFAAMFLDEARLAARIHHPNVVATLDVVKSDDQIYLVMEYVDGESLFYLLKTAALRGEKLPIPVVSRIVSGALHGVHAAHEAKSDKGEALGIVHRDVSPQNILVGVDGIARVLDFGVAKARHRAHTTQEGQLKGKLAYMSPEQVLSQPVTPRTDVFAAAVVLWEALAMRRLFFTESDAALIKALLDEAIAPPSKYRPDIPAGLDDIVMRGLERDPAKRWASAEEMADALEAVVPPATTRETGKLVRTLGEERLVARAEIVARVEASSPGDTTLGRRTAPKLDDLPPADVRTGVGVARTNPAPSVSAPKRSWALWGGIALVVMVFGGGAAVLTRPSATPAVSPASAPPPGTGEPPVAAQSAPSPTPPPSPAAPPAPPTTDAPLAATAATGSTPSATAPKPVPKPAAKPWPKPTGRPSGDGLYSRD